MHTRCDQVGFNVGILYAYAVGSAGRYTLLNLTCLAIPIVSVLLFVWMPETPQYLLSKDNRAGATAALQWLRGKRHNVEHELQQLKVSGLHPEEFT
jgi:SP family facilitated glucose transporter-like MFS transporter 8